MNNITYSDNDFKLQDAAKYHLSIQLSLEAICFAVLDTEKKKYLYFKYDNFSGKQPYSGLCRALEEKLSEERLFGLSYKSVAFYFLTQKATLVPQRLFDKEYLEDYFRFTHTFSPETEQLFYNDLAQTKAYNVFAVPECIVELTKKYLRKVTFFHHSAPFIEYGFPASLKAENTPYKVAISVYSDMFEMAVKSDNQLVFYNTFAYRDAKDFAYYVLNVFEQLHLDYKTTPVVLSGHIRKNHEFYSLLTSYLGDISFYELDPTFEYSHTFDIYEHTFVNLFNLYRCV